MNRYAFLATALVALLYAAPAAAPVQAADTIRRCEAADGSVGYTNASCEVFDQQTVSVTAIVYEDDNAPGNLQPATLAAMDRRHAAGRRSAASGCARSPTRLQMDLRGAFALGDVNRVAECYHWVGMDSPQAKGPMDGLQRLAARPVLDTQHYGPGIGAMLADAGGGGGGGVLQLVLAGDGGSASVVDFDVHRYAGCYFVS